MTKTRTFTKKIEMSGNTYRLHRFHQPIKKDGSDAKKQGWLSREHLVVYPDGSYRYYNRNGLLGRDGMKAERREAEIKAGLRRIAKASLRDVTLGRV